MITEQIGFFKYSPFALLPNTETLTPLYVESGSN